MAVRPRYILWVALAIACAVVGWFLVRPEISDFAGRTDEPFPVFTEAAPPAVRSGFGTTGEIGRLRIAAVGADAQMVWTQVDHGTFAVPSDVATVGLWNSGALPTDAIGPMVVAGHITDNVGKPGALVDLTKTVKGDTVNVVAADKTYSYRVVDVEQFHKEALPPKLFNQSQPHRLYVVSCANRVRLGATGFHYTDNVVVSADLVPDDTTKSSS